MAEIKRIVRVARTDLDGTKPIRNALRKIKGVNFSFANMLCSKTGVNKTDKAGELDEDKLEEINNMIENPGDYDIPDWMMNRRRDFETNEDNHLIKSDLEFAEDQDIKRLKKTKAYRGVRHAQGLPVRGQRTRSNFRDKGTAALGVQRARVEGGEEE